ncbi:hypothetical protein MKX03_025890 [Papaver bracteatum]|nr:hypothetical protein MKX03_025890 [Papaver bracteatum]
MSSFPPIIYPNTATAQPASHHSRGSFGPVFAVLAVVVVLSAIACIIGQICAHHHHPKHQQNKDSHHQIKHPMMESNLHDDEEGDIEFGFKPRMQIEKPERQNLQNMVKVKERIFAEQSKARAF